MKNLGICSPGLRNIFEIFVKLSGLPPTYLMYTPLDYDPTSELESKVQRT